uniref:Uncharacterized protein n=1 Tax=Anguilla anguilla TaxID=7936 RepID=A0A0E9WZG6_ANGAN
MYPQYFETKNINIKNYSLFLLQINSVLGRENISTCFRCISSAGQEYRGAVLQSITRTFKTLQYGTRLSSNTSGCFYCMNTITSHHC